MSVKRIINGVEITGRLHENGGGFVADEATVAVAVYVADKAMVLGGKIFGGKILGGTIYEGTIHGGTIYGGTIYGGWIHGGTIYGGTIHGGTFHGDDRRKTRRTGGR